MNRILIINSNSSSPITGIIEKALFPYAYEDSVVDFINPDVGPEGIDTALDIAISGIETARIVAQNKGKYDAFVIACGSDPGLDTCRTIVDEPVVGIAEASMLMACMLGAKFSIIVNKSLNIPFAMELVNRYGLDKRLASVRSIELSTAELGDRKKMFNRIAEVGGMAVQEDFAEVIILPGSVMVGQEEELAELIGAPVLAGLICGFQMAKTLIEYGQKTSKTYKYRMLKKQDRLRGYDDMQNVYSL